MRERSRSARFGLLIAVAAIAVPLLAAGSAHAAMAGAPPGTTTLRPDLRSANVTNVDPSTGVATIEVCFDKPIASVPTASQIFVGGYSSFFTLIPADNAVRASNPNCADATWSTTVIEPTQRTFVQVGNPGLAGIGGPCAVANVANGYCNLPDSVALGGSSTHNGTRGFSIAPDLTGITINQATLTVNYVFDQQVTVATSTAACWTTTTLDGIVHPSSGVPANVTFSGDVVAVKFTAPGALGNPGPPPNPVVRAQVGPQCVQGRPDASTLNPSRESATASGTGGVSNNPDLIAVTLADDQSYADFTFDENVSLGPNANNPGDFIVATSDDPVITCTHNLALSGADIVAGNTVRVPLDAFTGIGPGACGTDRGEYLVWGYVNDSVVTSTVGPPGRPNPQAGVPTGSNSGAFANGFTTGPDAYSTAFNASTGVVTINLDQRFSAFNTGSIRLVDDAGALIPGNPTSVAGAGGPAGPVVANAQFTPGQVAGAKSVQLLGTSGFVPAFDSIFGDDNVNQVLSPTATAKRQVRHGHVVWHKAVRHRLRGR